MSIIKQTSIVIISSLFALSALIAETAKAETNPFASQALMTVVSMHDNTDAKCGEGKAKAKAAHKCGEGMVKTAHKCGEGKAKSAHKCGEGMTNTAAKCGEGKAKTAAKCGEGKVKPAAKCGEGKCGEGKMKAKKCGG